MEVALGSLAGWKNRLKTWTAPERLRQHEDKVLLVLTLVIGAIVGLVIALFIVLTEDLGARLYPSEGSAWRRLMVPILGALITGILLKRYFPEARGSGIPQTKAALFLNNGYVSMRTVVGKFLLSGGSLASGIALGREGPSVQIGAGIASALGRRLGLGPSRIRALVPVGASAALAAAFNTPVAAVLFSMEEILGDFHAPVLGSIVLSAATSWIVMHLVLGDEPLFHVPAYQLVHPIEFVNYALLGVAGGLVSVGFVRLLLWQRKKFRQWPAWTESYRPVAGGLAVGIMGVFVPAVLGVGYSFVGQALNGQMALGIMVLLVVLKVVATTTCYSSGSAGGIFGPSLFIGAMLGGAIGSAVHALLPDYSGSAGAYALVGMGTTFAGIVRVPLTSVIMIFEITRNYSIIVPLMISNLVSFFISYKLQRVPIYEALQHQEGLHLPATGPQRARLLSVREAVSTTRKPLSTSDTVAEALEKLGPNAVAWPVARYGEIAGIIRLDQLKRAADIGRGQATLADLLPREGSIDFFTAETFPHVHPDHPADTALRRMAQAKVDALAVLSRANVKKLVGVIALEDIQSAYALGEEDARPVDALEEGASGRNPFAFILGVVGVTVAALILVGVASRFYRADREERASDGYRAGLELQALGQSEAAVEQLRNALSFSPDNKDYRLALGTALVAAGQYDEAPIYLSSILQADPQSGPANLGIARVAAARLDMREAVDRYNRAIFGEWAAGRERERIDAQIELANFLAKNGERAQAVAEWASLADREGADSSVRKQAGRALIQLGDAQQAGGVFSELLNVNDRDAEAYAGLGEAEFNLERYRAAIAALNDAVKWGSTAPEVSSLKAEAEKILALDPTLRGLSSSERYRRSVELLGQTVDLVQRCARVASASTDAANSGSARRQTEAVADLLKRAKGLVERGTPRSGVRDAYEENIAVAEQLWNTRGRVCGSAAPAGPALSRVMAAVMR